MPNKNKMYRRIKIPKPSVVEKAEISKLEKQIDSWEGDDLHSVPHELMDFRHRVFFVHSSIEGSLHILIQRAVSRMIHDKIDFEDKIKLSIPIGTIIKDFSYSKLLDTAKDLKVIPNNLYTLARDINKLRNRLAHPKPFDLLIFARPDIKIRELKKISKGYKSMAELLRNEAPVEALMEELSY